MAFMSWTNPDERLAAIRARHAAGKKQKFIFFWGHRPERDGRVGQGCFSQWWPSPFTVDGVTYGTAEHWMMAGKARLFGDEPVLAKILAAPSPAQAKQLGRQVRGFDQDRWLEHRYQLVAEGNLAKFGQYPKYAEVLRASGSRVLVEASPVDRIWGIGLAADNEAATDPTRWRGLNLLGFALMDVREVFLREA
ncbi:NADAR family protein [Kineosporia mesophila]|uniref:NADAR family protein n=2 Tax=Kineosporia mesophila TaxID=566012 RepID=A0ABP7AVE9_9ACTN